MGRVYLASDPNIERQIALKVLMPERLRGAGGEERRKRFLQEARAAGGLSHRGIVTIYDAGTDPESGYPYLAMEWVRGCSLKTLLGRDGPLEPARAASMAAQVARALDYAMTINHMKIQRFPLKNRPKVHQKITVLTPKRMASFFANI